MLLLVMCLAAMPDAHGILALWNDCRAGHEADYESWYQTEHLFERLAVPGFRFGRRFQRVEGGPEYFTYYRTETPAVLTSPAYRKLLDHPTPMTERIMSETFLNMSRTVCRISKNWGGLHGAWAVTVKLARLDPDGPARLLAEIAGRPDVARAEIWDADDDITGPPTREEELRGGDRKIAACLVVETLREDAARRIAGDLDQALSGDALETAVYRLLCHIDAKTDPA